jgi:glutathione S-transferase
MQIYGDLNSGNCLKVKHAADYLGLAYSFVPVDLMQGETRTAAFLALNDMGQVPVIRLDDGRTLAQSNAILRFLARGTRLLPDDPYLQAKVDELLFWEQYTHEPSIAVCRFQMVYLGKPAGGRDADKVERGEKALDFMEKRLESRRFFVGESFTIADVALFGYTRLAHEGGFDLSTRSNVSAWIAACEHMLALPPLRHV